MTPPNFYEQLLRHERFQSSMLGAQTGLMEATAHSIHRMNHEMAAIRQSSKDALAIQQQMLQQEELQGAIEEWVFNLRSMIDDWQQPGCEIPRFERYLMLMRFAESAESSGVCTAMVRGLDNKAAFTKVMADLISMYDALALLEDVKEGLAWADAEQQRLAEEQTRKAEEQARNEEKQRRSLEEAVKKRQPLRSEIARLQATRKSVTLNTFVESFTRFLGRLDPSLKTFGAPIAVYVLALLLVVMLPFLFFLIPLVALWYFMESSEVQRANAPIDEEIKRLQSQLRELD